MPQYLVANYLPDNFDPSTVTEAMMEEIHALNREMIAAGVRKFACGIAPPANAKTVRKQSDGKVRRHRWAVHRDQGAHGRLLDTGSRQYGRGTRVGAQGCHHLRCGGRGARASFLPGSGGSNGIARCPEVHVLLLDVNLGTVRRTTSPTLAQPQGEPFDGAQGGLWGTG